MHIEISNAGDIGQIQIVMKLTGKQVAQGEMAPWWYGVAYYYPCSDYTVCYPVPFNLIVRWSRATWWALRRGKEDALSEAYARGRTEGRRERRSDEERENQRVAGVIRRVRD